MNPETIFYLWLSLALGSGSRSVFPLFAQFSSAREIYENRASVFSAVPLSEKEKHALQTTPLAKAQAVAATCVRKGFGVVHCNEKTYPGLLRHIYDFPPVLYHVGQVVDLESCLSISVVGTRNPTGYAKEATRLIVGDLAKSGVVVVSGLAVGIDAIAHKTALDNGGKTIAVVGGGLDINYPKENENLRRAIEAGGTVLSEYPPGVAPEGWHFPVRNRIIAGLCQGVLVVEGSLRSGTLSTARHAVEEGRNVYAVPGSIFNVKADGTFQLLKEGAIPVRNALDVLEDYLEQYSGQLTLPARPDKPKPTEKQPLVKNRSSLFKETSNNGRTMEKTPGAKPAPMPEKQPWDLASLTPKEQAICAFLREKGSAHADEIGQVLALSPSEVLARLTELELAGVVEPLAGRVYRLDENRKTG